MSVVPPELGVDTLQRRISRGLGLLDAVQTHQVSFLPVSCPGYTTPCRVMTSDAAVVRSLSRLDVPVTVRLARLVVLGRVL